LGRTVWAYVRCHYRQGDIRQTLPDPGTIPDPDHPLTKGPWATPRPSGLPAPTVRRDRAACAEMRRSMRRLWWRGISIVGRHISRPSPSRIRSGEVQPDRAPSRGLDRLAGAGRPACPPCKMGLPEVARPQAGQTRLSRYRTALEITGTGRSRATIEKTAKNPILAAAAANPRNHWWFSRVFHTAKSAQIRK